MKILLVGDSLLHEYSRTERYTDRQRDKLKYVANLISTFRDSASKANKEKKIVKTGIHSSEYLISFVTKDIQ
jgi:hypothetical protein